MSLEFARFRDITEYSTNAMLISNENPTAALRSGDSCLGACVAVRACFADGGAGEHDDEWP